MKMISGPPTTFHFTIIHVQCLLLINQCLWPVLHQVHFLQEGQVLLSLLWFRYIHPDLENQDLQQDPGDPEHTNKCPTAWPLTSGAITAAKKWRRFGFLPGLLLNLENQEPQHFPGTTKDAVDAGLRSVSSTRVSVIRTTLFTKSPFIPAAPLGPSSPLWPFSPGGPWGPGKPGGPWGPCTPRGPGAPCRTQITRSEPGRTRYF